MSTARHVRLPPAPEVALVDGQVVLSEAEFDALAVFDETAHMLEEALHAREDQVVALETENRALVRAGALLEARLELIGRMYENEARSCRLVQLVGYGALGASFLILGAGAL